MIALQRPENNLFELLFQLLALAVIFGLPVLRSVLEALRRKAGEAKPQQPAPRAGDAERRPTGLEQWRELLRGEPRRAESRPAQPVVPRQRLPEKKTIPKPIQPPPDLRKEPAHLVGLPTVPLAPGAGAPDPMWAGGSSLRPAGAPISSLPTLGAPIPGATARPPETSARPIGVPGGLPSARRAATGDTWRRAIVLSEILAPPIALRGSHDSWTGTESSRA